MQRVALRSSALTTARRGAILSPRRTTILPRNVVSALRSSSLSTSSSTNSNSSSSNSSSSSSSSSAAPTPSGNMKPKQFTIALLSGLVLAGAWYYKDSISASLGTSSSPSPPSSSPRPVVSQQPQHQSFSTSAVTPAAAASKESEEPKKVILIDNESLYTGTLPAGEKVSKEVDNSGRKIVEMLSPEQATEKLRRNEESYIVGRGRGVWRYDVVQVPSNDPIEDDHDEKIIEVPQTVVPVEGEPSSDWMFWGVFDGHRFVETFFTYIKIATGSVTRHTLPYTNYDNANNFSITAAGQPQRSSARPLSLWLPAN
jgi:hypothetical protein